MRTTTSLTISWATTPARASPPGSATPLNSSPRNRRQPALPRRETDSNRPNWTSHLARKEATGGMTATMTAASVASAAMTSQPRRGSGQPAVAGQRLRKQSTISTRTKKATATCHCTAMTALMRQTTDRRKRLSSTRPMNRVLVSVDCWVHKMN